MRRTRRARRVAQRQKQKEQSTGLLQRQKRNRRLAWGLSLALAVGAAFTLNGPRPKKHELASKPPISEPIMKKKKISFHLMYHLDRKNTLCSIDRSLKKAKPDLVFFEVANHTHEAGKLDDTLLQNPDADRFLSDGEYPIRSIVKTIRSYAGLGVKIFTAESYSSGEYRYLSQLEHERGRFLGQALDVFFKKGPLEPAIDFHIRSRQQYGKYMRLRNDRIFRKITRTIGQHGGSALLIVGTAHRNLVQMFSNAGYETAVPFDTKTKTMSSYYERIQRGWSADKTNERDAAARHLAVSLLNAHYQIRRFGGRSALLVAEQTIPQSFSMEDLRKVRRKLISTKNRSQIDIAGAFSSSGYNVPTTKAQFIKAERRLESGRCE